MQPHPYPEDLVALQHAWTHTYEALADPAQRDRTALLRRGLIGLSVRLQNHPYWASTKTPSAERVHLRRYARWRETGAR